MSFGLILTERTILFRLLAIGAMLVGIFSIYLSQGRTSLVVVGLAGLAIAAVLLRRGEKAKLLALLGVGFAVAVVGTAMAFAVGGQFTIDRWTTLVAANPDTVYQQNRGQFVDELITSDMWMYPLGAGGGRWGMMNVYFGEPGQSLYAEMQWQALLYDGGIPLIVLYVILLAVLLSTAWRIAVDHSNRDSWVWGSVMVGYTLAIASATFVFPVLIKEITMQLLLLSSCLWSVTAGALAKVHYPRRAARGRKFSPQSRIVPIIAGSPDSILPTLARETL